MDDKTFNRFLFKLVSFIMTMGLVLYGLYVHDWSLVIGVASGVVGLAINEALKSE